MNTRNTTTSSYHSKGRTTQGQSHIPHFVWDKDFSNIFLCLGEAKVSTVNSDLTNLVHFQRFYENINWIMFLIGFILCLQKRWGDRTSQILLGQGKI